MVCNFFRYVWRKHKLNKELLRANNDNVTLMTKEDKLFVISLSWSVSVILMELFNIVFFNYLVIWITNIKCGKSSKQWKLTVKCIIILFSMLSNRYYQGLKGSLIHKYFVKWGRVGLLLVLKVCIKVCISWEGHSLPLRMPLFLFTIKGWFTDPWCRVGHGKEVPFLYLPKKQGVKARPKPGPPSICTL